jgi:hypothetical protein
MKGIRLAVPLSHASVCVSVCRNKGEQTRRPRILHGASLTARTTPQESRRCDAEVHPRMLLLVRSLCTACCGSACTHMPRCQARFCWCGCVALQPPKSKPECSGLCVTAAWCMQWVETVLCAFVCRGQGLCCLRFVGWLLLHRQPVSHKRAALISISHQHQPSHPPLSDQQLPMIR